MEERQSPSARSECNEENLRKSFPRSYIACVRCHGQKVKCSGKTPCRNCQQSRKPVECVYPVRDRKIAVSESYLKNLEAENNALKRKRSPEARQSMESDDASGQRSLPALSRSEMVPRGQNHTPGPPTLARDNELSAETGVGMRLVSDEISIQPVHRGEASLETFGARFLQYIRHEERQPSPRPYVHYKHPRLLRILSTDCKLPNKNYAKLLVRAVLRFIGGDHHLLLKKSFLERLEETYQLEVLDDPVWLCRLFTVLALGELYSKGGTKTGPGIVPGTDFFMKAMGLFQDMHEEPTVSYIETLLLLSFYLVALNRRNTAYAYAGLALRLSLTLGLHRRIPEDSGLSAPEREHRVRVWWTCYALDRIYTSKVGLPVMLRDEDIDVQMPSMDGLSTEEAEDFYPPELMTAQIKLARITGNIMSDLYRIPQPGRVNTFVQSVQRTLASLRHWHETLPKVLKLDFSAMPIYPSRSVASLHLHFGNAVIQTTRPILFHLFRSQFRRTPTNTSPDPTTKALAEACIQAAKTSNSILAQLWVDGCLASYGYFDSISVFSSTMILMMSAAMKDNDSYENDDVETAWSLLRFMRDAGNLPASGYYDQLIELKVELDALKARQQNGVIQAASENAGLQMLLAATGSVAGRQERQNTELAAEAPAFASTDTMMTFGVGDGVGAVLDNPFLQDFLQHHMSNWAPESFDPVSGVPAAQFQFDWENANLFGNL